MTDPLLTAALSYAARGWPVFPLHSIRNGRCTCGKSDCGSPGKHPRTANGLKDASTDPAKIREWWRRWPDANAGIVTGAVSGIVAIDVDPRHGGDETLRVITHEHDRFPDTVEAATGGGGQHFIFQHPGGVVRNRANVAAGIDVRGDGGYIAAAPSNHISGGIYQWTRSPENIDAAPMPDWLLELVNPAPATPPPPIPRRPVTPRQDGNGRYGAAALADELDELRAAPEGQRNDHLNRSTFRLAQLVADGHLDGDVVRRELQVVGESIGLPSREVANTIRSGMNGGASKPRSPAATPAAVTPPADPPPPWTPFPVDALPDVFRAFCEAASDTMRVDPTFLALPLLATAAGSIGNTTRVRVRADWFEPAILWAVLVAESGTLKTPCLRSVLRPIYDRQREAIAAHERAMVTYVAAMEVYKADAAAWKKDRTGEQPIPPTPPIMERFIVSDCTVEALAGVLQDAPRGVLLHRDELSGWIGSFDQYKMTKGSDAAHWLAMHTAEPLLVDRKGSGTTYVPHAAVSIIGGTQPGTLRRAITAEHRESGLLARMLAAMPPRVPKTWTEQGIPDEVSGAVGDVFVHLLGLRPDNLDPWKPRIVDLAPDARRQVFATFYNEHALAMDQETGDIASAMSKLEGCCPRLALILHLVKVAAGEYTEHVGKVDAPTMRQAVTITRWFIAETMRVYRVLPHAGEPGSTVLEWLKKRPGRVATVNDLTHGPRAYRGNTAAAQAAFDDLAERGLGKWEWLPPSPRGGPSTRVFRVALAPVTPPGAIAIAGASARCQGGGAENAPDAPPDDDLLPPEVRFAGLDEAAAEQARRESGLEPDGGSSAGDLHDRGAT